MTQINDTSYPRFYAAVPGSVLFYGAGAIYRVRRAGARPAAAQYGLLEDLEGKSSDYFDRIGYGYSTIFLSEQALIDARYELCETGRSEELLSRARAVWRDDYARDIWRSIDDKN